MVGTTGFEPATSSVSRKRSNQLSYAPVMQYSSLSGSGLRRKEWAVASAVACCTIVSTEATAIPLAARLACYSAFGQRAECRRGNVLFEPSHDTNVSNPTIESYFAPLPTCSRCCASAWRRFWWPPSSRTTLGWASGLFVAAGLTDALDGTAGARAQATHHAGPVSRSGGRQAAAQHAVSGAHAQGPDSHHGHRAGLWQGCGHPAGGGHSLCGSGPARISAQHLRQGQHPGPGSARWPPCCCTSSPRSIWVVDLRQVALEATMVLTVVSGSALRLGGGATRRNAQLGNGQSPARPKVRLDRDQPQVRLRSGLIVLETVFGFGGFFDLHVAELLGVKDLATLQALDKFRVFVPGDDSYLGVFADGCHCSISV